MREKTIAVLPFVNISKNSDFEYFSDGITEEIINALAKINTLQVTSRTSSFYFKNINKPISQIAEELSVSIILEGSVRLANNMVRITAQLIQPENDFHLWSETWDRKLDNIFEIQDEISLQIAERLREHYGHFDIDDHLIEKKTDNFDAFNFALKAKYHFNKWNPSDVHKAIDLFQKALDIDSRHVDAHVGLADAYSFLAVTEMMPLDEAWPKVRLSIDNALYHDADNAGAYYQLANLAFFREANFQQAMKYTLQSVELKHNYPEAHQFLLFLHCLTGNNTKAKEHLDIILDIDPLSQETYFYHAYYLYRTGKPSEAVSILNRCLDENPLNIPAYMVKSYCLIQMGKYDETIGFIESMPAEITIPDEKLGIRCIASILKKDEELSKQLFLELKEAAKNKTSFQAHEYLYLVYAIQSKADEAFSWLDSIIDSKSPIIMLGYNDPLAWNLTADSRFELYKQKIFDVLPISENAAKKKTVIFSEKEAQEHIGAIQRFMTDEKPFLTPNLSLRSLADHVQMHPNKLSWLLNDQLGKNFNEFINYYRIEYFKELVKKPENAHISLLGIAYESGFNSKTVFNTYFKKEVGMTPKEYVNQK